VREELRLVGGDVDARGAVALASLAGEAEVQRLLDPLVAPSAGDRLSLEHLEEQPYAPARRVLLLAGDHVARAHRPVPGAPALPKAEATLGRAGEVTVIVDEGEARLDRGRVVPRAQPQVLVELVGVGEHLARVQLVVGVPDRLELVERPAELVAEHPRQKLGAELPLAVLPG